MGKIQDGLKDVFQLFFRMIPFPTEPGLIKIGNPGRKSPVLLTTNYDLTVRRVVKDLQSQSFDCYLLVAPAGGINVWCAAGGGHLTIDSIISVLKTTKIGDLVDRRRLLLPQLCANGIDMFEVKRRTGWTAVFGPTYAKDIPAFFQNHGRVTDSMIRVTFTIKERLEMATAMATSLSLRYAIFPVLIFGLSIAPGFILTTFVFSFLISLLCSVIPGQTSLQQGGVIGLSGVLVISAMTVLSYLAPATAVKWGALCFLTGLLVGATFPGYSPHLQCGYSKLFYGFPDLNLKIVPELCIGCKICDNVCPVECFAKDETGRKYVVIDKDPCIGCMACVINCPTDAVINELACHVKQETIYS